MNQEQFGQFWTQLKAPLKAEWEKITDEDLLEIDGNLATLVAWFRNGMARHTRMRLSPGSTADILTGPEIMWGRDTRMPIQRHHERPML
jgi:hypothetical protein